MPISQIIVECPKCGKQILKESTKSIYLINNTCDKCNVIMEEVIGDKIVAVTIDGIKSVEGDDLWENFFKIATRIEIGYISPNIQIKLTSFKSLIEKKNILKNYMR